MQEAIGDNLLPHERAASQVAACAAVVAALVSSAARRRLAQTPSQLIRECLLGTSDTRVPRTPLTDKATVMGVWIFYTLFVVIAFGVEKIGSRRRITPS